EKRISSIDDDIALFEQRDQFIDDRVNWRSSLHHHHCYARLFQRSDKLLNRAGWLNVFAFGTSDSEFLGNFRRAIEYSDRKSLRFDVECEIFAHHTQTDQANITLIRIHFGIFFSNGSKTRQLTVAST